MVGHLGFPIHHAYYAPYFTNCSDEVLNGSNTEVFTFPYELEGVELFWSVTRYSALTRNTLPGKNDIYNAYNTEPYYFVVRYYKPNVADLPPKPCNLL